MNNVQYIEVKKILHLLISMWYFLIALKECIFKEVMHLLEIKKDSKYAFVQLFFFIYMLIFSTILS